LNGAVKKKEKELTMPAESEPGPAGVDLNNLYRQETYSDPGFGSIQMLRPVTADGDDDPARPPLFIGATQLMTPRGPLPIQCEIEAKTLREAAEKMPAALEKSVQEIITRAQEYERERAGGIVIPAPGSRITLP